MSEPLLGLSKGQHVMLRGDVHGWVAVMPAQIVVVSENGLSLGVVTELGACALMFDEGEYRNLVSGRPVNVEAVV